MGNIQVTLQRLLKNKNTVTIIGVIVIMALLYFGYKAQIDSKVNPVQVPVARETIQPKTLIKSDMIDYVDVAPVVLGENVLQYDTDIIGKYTNYNTVVPQGSMFYEETVVSKDELPDSSFVKVKKGEVVYNFPVDMDSTYGNSIFPGNKIDIYMKAEAENGQIMVGKLIENIEVLDVKDSSGQHVFENSEEQRTPAFLIFGVKDDINILLRKASYMYSFSVELFPVPHGGKVDNSGSTEVSTQYLKDFINANTVSIPEEQTQETASPSTSASPTTSPSGNGNR
jgi:hypothetical secreted protein